MKFVTAVFSLSLSIIFSTQLFAQEQLGLRFDNYSGINGVTLNPTSNLTSPFRWDINLVAAGVFVENNYGYIGNTSVLNATKADNIYSAPDLAEGFRPNENDLVADYYNNGKKKYGSAVLDVMGPSFMVNLESGHSFGLFTRVRASASIRNIPSHLGYYQVKQVAYEEPVDISKGKSAGMGWSEIGVNYAINMPTSDGNIGFGINLKFLQGYEAYYFKNSTNTSITNSVGDTISFPSANFEFAFTDSNTEEDNTGLSNNGNGLGIDLGASMVIGSDGRDYTWKFGASIIDIGRINFKNNAQKHVFQTNTPFSLAAQDYESITDVDKGIQKLSQDVLEDSLASRAGNQFGIWLPAALSLQADYQFIPNLYVNATLVQRIPMGKAALQRDNLLAISPRLETRWFGASLPLVLYNYTDFRVGTALRLGYLTLGTDHIGSLFGQQKKFSGADFYVALKINPFKLNLGGGGRRRGKGVKCYDF